MGKPVNALPSSLPSAVPSAAGRAPTSQTSCEDSEHLLGQFIPLHYHYQMLLDESRVSSFENAIRLSVPEGGKVVELGGGTGILSYFSARKASRVWCVERNPQMAQAARSMLALNGVSSRVEIVEGEAMDFCPPEEVDVVVCEMLHSALLREKQIQVIDAFKKNYRARFGKLPKTFIPEATILAVQPVQQDFEFHSYLAPIPLFFEPHNTATKTTPLCDPLVYSLFEYRNELKAEFQYQIDIKLAQGGVLNALRFVTKNVLAIDAQTNSTVDWHNFYCILPLAEPLKVNASDRVSIAFSYLAGGSIESLSRTIRVTKIVA